MLVTYPFEAENAEALRKARETDQDQHELMKAALRTPAAGLRTGGDVVPFRKTAPPRPRPPVQQPLRPAAADDLRKYIPDGRGGLLLNQLAYLDQPNRAKTPAEAYAIEIGKDAARERAVRR
jgi:hypothetical protein